LLKIKKKSCLSSQLPLYTPCHPYSCPISAHRMNPEPPLSPADARLPVWYGCWLFSCLCSLWQAKLLTGAYVYFISVLSRGLRAPQIPVSGAEWHRAELCLSPTDRLDCTAGSQGPTQSFKHRE
jgi:hypothetical protein